MNHHLNSDRGNLRTWFLYSLVVALGCAWVNLGLAEEMLTIPTRSLEESQPGSGEFRPKLQTQQWKPSETAIIVCDMWDTHTSENAALRVAEMAPRMNRVLKTARKNGVTIIHAPSSCMQFYKDHPARKNAVQIPRSKNLPKDIGSWCYQIPSEEQGVYPLDQSDGGKDDDPIRLAKWTERLRQEGRNVNGPWIRQIEALTIEDDDYISDNGEEIWSILEQRGVDSVILLGVHTNMCVLGRPFGLRQMAQNNKNVVLMRDMTDTMYNPRRSPFVSHFTGTDLIVEHIEKYVCPTTTSVAILGGKEFRFQADKRPHIVFVIAEREYKTDQSLPVFAKKHLGKDFKVSYVYADPEERNRLGGAEVISEADLLFVSVRRRVLPESQLKLIRDHVAAGKPVVGIRTTSHAFSVRRGEIPEGHAEWPEWDHEVIGGNYQNHHGNGPVVTVSVAYGSESHPLLSGVKTSELKSFGSLYKSSPLQKTATPLLIGAVPEKQPEPVAWTNKRQDGGKTFYTSMGHIKDFEQPAFNRLLLNGIYWAAGLEVTLSESSQASSVLVSGTVTLDGRPLESARVTFDSVDHKGVATGTTSALGTYTLTDSASRRGVAPGEYKVIISKPLQGKEQVPRKYNRESALKVQVKTGENVFQFDLSD